MTDRRSALVGKVIALAALVLCIQLIFFKFLPDVGTSVVQNDRSVLTDFSLFENYYFTPDSVHYARFLSSRILHSFAVQLAHVYHSNDLRLHPLRIAAALLTAIYALIGASLALQDERRYCWRSFMACYMLTVLVGLYVFYPADMPAFASLSVTLYFILAEQMAAAFVLMLVTGIFRETSFHAVWFVFAWSIYNPSIPARRRVAWIAVFAVAFACEYLAIRQYFPGPLSAGSLSMSFRDIFFGKGLWSLTTICSLGLAILFPAACLAAVRDAPKTDWRVRFFALNCYVFPLWIVFYRVLGGNISEFRLLWPAILPCVYGIAYLSKFSYSYLPKPVGDTGALSTMRPR